MSELEEYKQTWKYEHENWTCAIYEVLLNDSTNYMVTFEDKLSGDCFMRRCDNLEACGDTLIDRLRIHYEVTIPELNLLHELNNAASMQLDAEDAIDTFTRRG